MSQYEGKLISLENFEPTARKGPYLNSPRSLEACRRQGIDPSELLIKTLHQIKELYKDRKLDEEGVEQMHKHYEERRREKIRILLEEREAIIEEEKNGLINFDNLDKRGSSSYGSRHFGANKGSGQSKGSQHGSGADSGIIERERRQLEKIKYRQEKEIKQVMEHELRMQEIRNKQNEKMIKQKEREEIHQLRVQQKREEEEEKRKQLELEKKQREEEELRRQKTMAQKAYEREMDFARREKERERERKIESRRKEEEQKRRHEEFVQQTEEKLLEQQRRVEARRKEMEEVDRIREENLLMQQQQRKLQSEEQRRIHEEKINFARTRNEQILEQRRQDFFSKKAQAEERKKELDEIAEIERRQKIQAEKEKQQYREQIKNQNDERLQNRIGTFLHKYHEMDQKVAATQRTKQSELQAKHNLEVIKQADKEENIRRISKMQEYHRQKIFERILKDNEKADRVKMERQSMMETRQTMRKEIEANKRKVIEDFEKNKSKKMEVSTIPSNHLDKSGSHPNLYSSKSAQNYRSNPSPQYNSGQQNKFEKSKPSTSDNAQRSKSRGFNSDAEKEIESLKARQNNDMLIVLEEEQENERLRENQIKSAFDPQDRKKMEKAFGAERARAHARIQQLADQHDHELRQVMKKYNINAY